VRVPGLADLFSEKKVFTLLIPIVGSLAILTIVLQTGNSQAGVFKQTVFESGTEGYNIYRIPTIVRAATATCWPLPKVVPVATRARSTLS